jgi:hypothetical protein
MKIKTVSLICFSAICLLIGLTSEGISPIENPQNKFLIWNDYKIEINQYGGLGRDCPHGIVWEQYKILQEKAKQNASPPNTIKGVLLVCPTTHATAFKKDDAGETKAGEKTTSMTSAEVKWALDQWRQWEEMVYVYSAGNAWLRTDIKIIDEPLEVRTNEGWNFWSGPKIDLLNKYIPFERGDYDSYNSIYNGKDMKPGPWGGTFGADYGPKGCGSSDNAWLSRAKSDERHGFVFWHEWLNQMCWATSNVMSYPEGLWSLYVFNDMGYRDDPINAWPWITSHRDVMRFIIRPGMWKRWTVTDPYISPAIDQWEVFGPMESGRARRISGQIDETERQYITMKMALEKYDHFNLTKAEAFPEKGSAKPEIKKGTYYFRSFISSLSNQEVRLWAAADERFQVWLNGVMVRDGWGTLRSTDNGRLIEKVTYTSLDAGLNTLVLELPNVDEKSKDIVEFRVRFCKPDGSGELPEGVTYNPAGVAGKIVPLKDEPKHEFTNPVMYKWADIGDNPWLKLPRLDENDLRQLTGIETLSLKTDHITGTTKVKDKDGKEIDKEVLAKQHLFLDVPEGAVSSPRIKEPVENAESLDNDLDFNWESLAWLRVSNRKGAEKDILLVRFDVAEPVLHLLKTKGRPANESIVGYVLEKFKLAYVVLVDLDGTPAKELDALNKKPE